MTEAQRRALIESLAQRAVPMVKGHTHYAMSLTAEDCEWCRWLDQYRRAFPESASSTLRREPC